MAAKKKASEKKNSRKATRLPRRSKKMAENPLPEGSASFLSTEEPARPLSDDSFWTKARIHMLLIAVVSFGIYANTLNHSYAVDDTMVILDNDFTRQGIGGFHGIFTEDAFVGFFKERKNLVAGGRYRPLSIATFALELELFGNKKTEDNVYDSRKKKRIKKTVYQPNYPAPGGATTYKKGKIKTPVVSHTVNVCLYTVLCLVLYLCFLEMFNPTRDKTKLKGYFIALAGSLLYASHPIHTEAVANIKGRDEIMVLLGSMLAIYWTLLSVNRKKKAVFHMVLAAMAFIVGIFSKENAITFLAIIPLSLYFFTKASWRQIFLRAGVFVGIGVGFLIIRAQVLELPKELEKQEKAMFQTLKGKCDKPWRSRELMNNPFLKTNNTYGTVYQDYSNSEELASILHAWQIYVERTILPLTLTNDYYPKYIRTVDGPLVSEMATEEALVEYTPEDFKETIPTFGHPKVLLSLLLHLLLGAVAIRGLFKKRAIAFCIIFYTATFSVISNLFFPIGSNLAERFLFLPTVGFSLACALGLYALVQRLSKAPTAIAIAKGAKISATILLVICSLYAIRTVIRNKAWKDDYTLFTTDIHNSPYSAKLNNALSGVFQEPPNWGSRESAQFLATKTEKVTKAWRHAAVAKALHPKYVQSWILFANANFHMASIKDALARNATDAAVRDTLILEGIKFFMKTHQAYSNGLKYNPAHRDIANNRANVNSAMLAIVKQNPQVLAQYLQQVQKQLAEKTSTEDEKKLIGYGYTILGGAYENLGADLQQLELARQYYTRASKAYTLSINTLDRIPYSPRQRDIHYFRGLARMNAGRLWGQRAQQLDKAIPLLEEAINQFSTDIQINNKETYSTKGSLVAYYTDALEAHNMAGTANGIAGKHLKAVQYYSRYLQAYPQDGNALRNVELAYIQLRNTAAAKGDTPAAQAYEAKRKKIEDRRRAIDPAHFESLDLMQRK